MRNSLEIIVLPITEVRPASNPVRVHNRHQRRKLKALLGRFGQVTPILVDADRTIIDGHAVHASLIELGYEEISVVIAPNRDPPEIRALRPALIGFPRTPRGTTTRCAKS